MSDVIECEEIETLIPHRFPFLLVDRCFDYVEGQSIRAIKCVSANEPFFQGHFPGRPLMPGVLQIEAMAQASSVDEPWATVMSTVVIADLSARSVLMPRARRPSVVTSRAGR